MSTNTVKVRLRISNKTESAWKNLDPVLLNGELAVSIDIDNAYKVGNGSAKWSALKYAYQDSFDNLSDKYLSLNGGHVANLVEIDNLTAGNLSVTGSANFINGISGNASSASKLSNTTSIGSGTQPVYFTANGVPVATTYSLNATVPSNAKFTDTIYSHPTTSGNKHIPSGGSSGQILRWSADGTAVWGADSNTTYTLNSFGITASATEINYIKGVTSALQSQLDGKALKSHTHDVATTSSSGYMNAAMVTKLNGIATGANAYSLPTASSTVLGGVKTSSTVSSASGYTACPIISGVPYYKDTNTTYSLSSFSITATAAELNYCGGVTSNIQTQLNNKLSLSGGTVTDHTIFQRDNLGVISVQRKGTGTASAAIRYANNDGTIGYMGMNPTNGDVYKWNSDASAYSRILDTGNYNSYVPTLSGTGATGTWGINITGTLTSDHESATYLNGVTDGIVNCTYKAYGAIFNAPVKDGRISVSTYPSKYNNVYLGYIPTGSTTNELTNYISWNAATGLLNADCSRANFLSEYVGAGGTRPTSSNFTPSEKEYGGMRKDVATSSMTTAKPPWEGHILTFFWDTSSGRYDSQLASNHTTGKLAVRGSNNGTWTAWRNVYDTSHIQYGTAAPATGFSGTAVSGDIYIQYS